MEAATNTPTARYILIAQTIGTDHLICQDRVNNPAEYYINTLSHLRHIRYDCSIRAEQ